MSISYPRQLSRIMGILVVLALVASLVITTPPVGAQSNDPKPDYLATFNACPQDIIPDAGFFDINTRDDYFADVNCIAYYAITRGTSSTTYSPSQPVIREHMALFLIRMAQRVGIEVPAPGAVPFADIGYLSSESQDAISQLAQLGITRGTSATTYTPARNVSRGEMALFLKRLMNLMDVPEYRGEAYGYTPSDVEDDVLADADVDAPYNDMGLSTVSEFNAVEELYELGVATGISQRAFGPTVEMSRAAMAQFMAAILNHSNLRPDGVTVQLTPSTGWEDYDVTAMVSARSPLFEPLDNERVDWFYSAADNGGLQSNGECDTDAIEEGDCIWDDDRDDLTDDFGNHYETFRAVAGEVVTFYAWMGTEDDEQFDEDTAQFSTAEARSDKGPEKFLITHNIPENAAKHSSGDDLNNGYIVDRDTQRSVRLTIQLEDADGQTLQRGNLEIEATIEEQGGTVETDDVDNTMAPMSEVTLSGRTSDDDETLITDQRGEATLVLNRPSGEGATWVTLTHPDVDEDGTFAVIWSKDDPVVFSAKPNFDLFQGRRSSRIGFQVNYDLYDQYGNRLNNRNNNVGRDVAHVFDATMTYVVYPITSSGSQGSTVPPSKVIEMTTSSSGRISGSVNTNDDLDDFSLADDSDYFLVITPTIATQTSGDNPDVVATYAEKVVVWIVQEADDEDALDNYTSAYPTALTTVLTNAGVDETEGFTEVSIDTGRDEFRTFFTIWEYDSNDDFLDSDNEDLTMAQFENLIQAGIEVGDLEIRLYWTSSAQRSVFQITS